MATQTGIRPMEDPEGPLERALIDEYLRTRGDDASVLAVLPNNRRTRILEEASAHVAAKLAGD